ncbi:MAG: hypothetical protein ACTSW1_15380 [Candidatus Hodarchaeales archaeon]
MEALKKNQKQWKEEYYNCLEVEAQNNENNQLLLEWITNQSHLWFSNFSDFGLILSKSINLFSGSEKLNNNLIYWFSSSRACRDCVDLDVNILKKMADSIGYDNILVVADFEDERDKKVFESKYKLYDQCSLFEPGEIARKLIEKTSFDRLFFVLNENNQMIFPTFIDSRFQTLNITLNQAIDYLLSQQECYDSEK